MKYRTLGKTGYEVSEISLGTWQLGGGWGNEFEMKTAESTLNLAIDKGINFIDTADAYQKGMSEKAIGKVVSKRKERVYVATKCGRKLSPHVAEGYTERNLRSFVDDSRSNLGMDTLDLLQLHCPPWEVYYYPEVFEVLERLKEEGKIRHFGVSVEKVEQGLKAIEYPGTAAVQMVFNIFRQRPVELFFREAAGKACGIIVRVPLASGLLTGKFSKTTVFGEKDHRNYNREGRMFDRGETFAGVDFDTGLEAVENLRELFPDNNEFAQYALRWILMFKEVSCIIPGASKPAHIESNLEASDISEIDVGTMKAIREIYEERIRPLVHQLW